ncbi:MAG: hypothetical protein QM731_25400 [Chitinophagaceae bacterium]
MKKIQQLGQKLTRNEMKQLSGGAAAIVYYRWACTEEGGNYYLYVCRANNPAANCGYTSCTNVGTCTASSYCP